MSTDKDAVTRSERVIEPENNAHTAGSPVISGRGLVFSAGGRNILDSLDIDVYKGERLVLLGANGCGKTTLMRTLARLNKLTSGTLEQNIVQKPGRRKPNAAWFKKVGFVYQNPTYQLFMPTLLAEASFRASSEQKAREMIEAFGLSGLEIGIRSPFRRDRNAARVSLRYARASRKCCSSTSLLLDRIIIILSE